MDFEAFIKMDKQLKFKKGIIAAATISIAIVIIILINITSVYKYFDPLTKYENAWADKDTLFFEQKVEAIKTANFNEVLNINLSLSNCTNVYYFNHENPKLNDKKNNNFEKYIRYNSYYFWKHYLETEMLFDDSRTLICDDLFLFSHIYTHYEKRQILRRMNN